MNETTKEREANVELNIQELLLAYAKKWKIIVICVAVVAIIALGWTRCFITPMYQAGITIYVNNNRFVEDKDYLTSADLSASIHLVKGYMYVAKSDTVLEEVAKGLGDQYTVSQLKSAITTAQIDETVIFGIYVTHEDPKEATAIANKLAEVIPVMIPQMIEGTSAKVLDIAKEPSSPYSPSYSRNVILGAAAGLLLALVYVTIMYLKDTRIKDENDLTDMFEFPILGRIPDFDSDSHSSHYGYKTEQYQTEQN